MAGGTGGHIFPGIAVARELRRARRAGGVARLLARARERRSCRRPASRSNASRSAGVRGKGWRTLLAAPFRRRCARSRRRVAIVRRAAAARGARVRRLRERARRRRRVARAPAAARARAEPRAGPHQPHARALRAARARGLPGRVRARRARHVGNPVRAEIAAVAAAGRALRRPRRCRCACWCSAAARARAASTARCPRRCARCATGIELARAAPDRARAARRDRGPATRTCTTARASSRSSTTWPRRTRGPTSSCAAPAR